MTTNQEKINEMRQQIKYYINKDGFTIEEFEHMSFLIQECARLEKEQVRNATTSLKKYYNV